MMKRMLNNHSPLFDLSANDLYTLEDLRNFLNEAMQAHLDQSNPMANFGQYARLKDQVELIGKLLRGAPENVR